MENDRLTIQPNCDDDYDPDSLSCAEALSRILAAVPTISESEIVPLREGLGRALAQSVISKIDVPSHTNSAKSRTFEGIRVLPAFAKPG